MSTFGPDMPVFTEIASGVRRLVAPNPSIMTGPGTNTYLLGNAAIAVIDPGPALPEHIEDIIEKSLTSIRWILVTHTHPDHSPGVLALAEKSGAEVLGMPPPDGEPVGRGRVDGDRRLVAGVVEDVVAVVVEVDLDDG